MSDKPTYSVVLIANNNLVEASDGIINVTASDLSSVEFDVFDDKDESLLGRVHLTASDIVRNVQQKSLRDGLAGPTYEARVIREFRGAMGKTLSFVKDMEDEGYVVDASGVDPAEVLGPAVAVMAATKHFGETGDGRDEDALPEATFPLSRIVALMKQEGVSPVAQRVIVDCLLTGTTL